MKKLFKLFFVLLLTGAMSISTVKQVDAAGVKLSAKKATVCVSRNFVLTLKNTKVSAKAKASNSKIKIKKIKKNTWKITGKKPGKATVTVKVNRKTYKCTIKVKKALSFTKIKPKIHVKYFYHQDSEYYLDTHLYVKWSWNKIKGATYYEFYELLKADQAPIMKTKKRYRERPVTNGSGSGKVRGVMKKNGKKYYTKWSKYVK